MHLMQVRVFAHTLTCHAVVKSVSGGSTQVCWWCCVCVHQWGKLCMWNATCTFKDVLELKLCTDVHNFRTPEFTLAWMYPVNSSALQINHTWLQLGVTRGVVLQQHCAMHKGHEPASWETTYQEHVHKRWLCWLYLMVFEPCTAGTTCSTWVVWYCDHSDHKHSH